MQIGAPVRYTVVRTGLTFLSRLLAAAVLLAGCTKNHEHKLRGTSITVGDAIRLAGTSRTLTAAPGQSLYSLTATLPDGVVTDETWLRPVLVDNTGGQHRFITSSIGRGNTSPAVFSATFEAPALTDPIIVRAGNRDLDFTHGTIANHAN